MAQWSGSMLYNPCPRSALSTPLLTRQFLEHGKAIQMTRAPRRPGTPMDPVTASGSMLSKAAGINEARACRAAEDAEETRQLLLDQERRQMRAMAQRDMRRKQLTSRLSSTRTAPSLTRSASQGFVPMYEARSPSASVEVSRGGFGQHPLSMSSFMGSVPLAQAVTAALHRQLGDTADTDSLCALTRVQLEQAMREARLEGLTAVVWQALLHRRYEAGELLSADDLADFQRGLQLQQRMRAGTAPPTY